MERKQSPKKYNDTKQNGIVRYKNELNSIRFRDFTAIDHNIFMALTFLLQNNKDREVVLNLDNLKKLSGYNARSHKTDTEFLAKIDALKEKLLNIRIDSTPCEHQNNSMHPFYDITTDLSDRTMKILVAERFMELINVLAAGTGKLIITVKEG